MAATLWLSLLAIQIVSLFFFPAVTTPLSFSAELVRRNSLHPTGTTPYADTQLGAGNYLMKIQLGTPPVDIIGVVDTGSELIWAQCLPCIDCKATRLPLFNPVKSSTYKDVTCVSSQCQAVKTVSCDSDDQGCPYELHSVDNQTVSIGTVGVDTLTLNSTSGQLYTLKDTIIGCGHQNKMPHSGMSGLIGLGWGPSSLISQMGDTIQGLFSYCFGSPTSKINFGENAIVSGSGTVSTLMFKKENSHHYFLNLEAVSVNGVRIGSSGTSLQASEGNIIIDSGTTYTYLPRDYYKIFKDAIISAVKVEMGPPGYIGELCFKSVNLDDFPQITMHFSGADLVLDRSNSYLKVSPDTSCITVVEADADGLVLFGNLAQQNYLVGYDTQSQIVSFKPTNCSSLWS